MIILVEYLKSIEVDDKFKALIDTDEWNEEKRLLDEELTEFCEKNMVYNKDDTFVACISDDETGKIMGEF